MQPQARQPNNPASLPSITTTPGTGAGMGQVQVLPVLLSPTASQAFPDLKWAATPPAPVLYQAPATHSLEYLAYKKAKQAAAATLANGRRSPVVSPAAAGGPSSVAFVGGHELNGTEGHEGGNAMDVDQAAPPAQSSSVQSS